MPLTILQIHNPYRIPGGEDAAAAAEKAQLESHGHRVLTYQRRNAELDGHPLQKALLPLTAVWSRRSYREVRELLRKENVDIVHIHNTLTMVSPSVFWAAYDAGVPVVHTLHNFRLLCPNGILMREGHVCEDCPRRGLGCAVRHSCYRGSKLQSLVGANILRFHRRKGTWRRATLVALTAFDKEKLLEYGPGLDIFTAEQLQVKPPVVDVPNTPFVPMHARKNQIVLVARLETLKGCFTAVDAWADDSLPPLVLVGDGPDEAALRELAKGKKIAFAGRLPHDQVLAMMAESKAVLVPSLCYESFGLTTAEAHCLGTPVVGSDLGNTGALITNGINGVKFTAGDPAALAAAVRTALETPFDGADIREKARAEYATEENYRALLGIYEKAKGEAKP